MDLKLKWQCKTNLFAGESELSGRELQRTEDGIENSEEQNQRDGGAKRKSL